MLLPGLWSFSWEEAVFWYPPCCQSLHFLLVCHWCPSSCCSGAESQRGWVCMSPKSIVGPLRGVSWESLSFFHCLNPHWSKMFFLILVCLFSVEPFSWHIVCVPYRHQTCFHIWIVQRTFPPTIFSHNLYPEITRCPLCRTESIKRILTLHVSEKWGANWKNSFFQCLTNIFSLCIPKV